MPDTKNFSVHAKDILDFIDSQIANERDALVRIDATLAKAHTRTLQVICRYETDEQLDDAIQAAWSLGRALKDLKLAKSTSSFTMNIGNIEFQIQVFKINQCIFDDLALKGDDAALKRIDDNFIRLKQLAEIWPQKVEPDRTTLMEAMTEYREASLDSTPITNPEKIAYLRNKISQEYEKMKAGKDDA